MPIARAIARSVRASGPSATSRARAVALISATVASRTRDRRVTATGSTTIATFLDAKTPGKHP
jgi:hypothetical protein